MELLNAPCQDLCLIIFPILLDDGGIRTGPTPFRYEYM